MTIEPVEEKKEESKIVTPDGSVKGNGQKAQKPLIQITLPSPPLPDMNASAPLSIGQHNACAQKNFKAVADLMSAIINNQKLMGMAVTELNKKVKDTTKNNEEILKTIRKLVGEEKENVKNETAGATKT